MPLYGLCNIHHILSIKYVMFEVMCIDNVLIELIELKEAAKEVSRAVSFGLVHKL